VARALAYGSHDITGVEINPIIATTIMQSAFPRSATASTCRPDVHIYVEDGRSFVRRSTAKYQVLQATLVDTWAFPPPPARSRFPEKQPLHGGCFPRLPAASNR